jgi:hypothetical protein
MIRAIVRLQACTTKPGRRAFVGKGWPCHGIAAGTIRFYEVTAPSWAQARKAIGDYDTTGKRTMAFSSVGPETVEQWETVDIAGSGCRIRPMPLGTTEQTR